MSTHNQCFGAKIRKNLYPCKPQFYYIKVGCKGVLVTRTCFLDDKFKFWPLTTNYGVKAALEHLKNKFIIL